MSAPEVRRARVCGASLAYRVAGAGHALVCVHGNFASKAWFTDLLEAPPRGWRVVALDLPNFGDSEAMPEPIDIPTYADYLRGFVAALALEPVTLLGHSLGGAVVQAYAAAHPEGLRGLVLVGSAGPGGLVTHEAHYGFLEGLRDDQEAMARALAPTMPTRRPAYFSALVEDALRMNPAAFSGNARALERVRVATLLRAVRCPVLVVRGGHDHLISEGTARETAAAFRGARLELLPDLGHAPQIEDPARFAVLLTDFLEALP